MRSVLISIRPQWVDKIVSGEKTVEVRKSKPKLEPPFKCYIYCTKEKTISEKLWVLSWSRRYLFPESIPAKMFGAKEVCGAWLGNEKVIGEFVCDKIFNIYEFPCSRFWLNEALLKDTCLSYDEIKKYAGASEGIYGWHISNLKIYDKPKEICDFRRQCKEDVCCERCAMYSENRGQCGNIGLTWIRPPQSWGYAEERKKP